LRWIVTGAAVIASEALRPTIGPAYSLYGLLLLTWFILVGLGLFRLAAKTTT